MDAAALAEAVAFLKQKTDGRPAPRVGVICGSGLSGLVNCLDDKLVVCYEEIPHFPGTTIAGHTGELVFGTVGKASVVLMRGRFHSYEGHDMKKVTDPVKVMRGLGVEVMIITNAAGGVNRSFKVGDLMLISDHLALPLLAGKHPLVGPNDASFGGPRFLPLSDAYDPALRQLVYETAQSLNMSDFIRPTGTYCFVSGPAYESAAESKMLLQLGGDSVGMSTIPEVVVARHCGMKVLGLSLITNQVRLPGDSGPAASHEEVLETVAMRSTQIEDLVRTVISKLDAETWASLESGLAANAEALAAKLASAPAAGASVKDRLLSLDISSMTPLQALNELNELKKLAANE